MRLHLHLYIFIQTWYEPDLNKKFILPAVWSIINIWCIKWIDPHPPQQRSKVIRICIKLYQVHIFSEIWSLLKRLHSLIKMKRLHEGELQYGEVYSVITTSRVCLRQVSITEKIISKPFLNYAICSSKSIISLFGTILYMYELFYFSPRCNATIIKVNLFEQINDEDWTSLVPEKTSGYGFG